MPGVAAAVYAQRVAELERELARATALLHKQQERAHDDAGISARQSAESQQQQVAESDECLAEGEVWQAVLRAALDTKTQALEALTGDRTNMHQELVACVDETESLAEGEVWQAALRAALDAKALEFEVMRVRLYA